MHDLLGREVRVLAAGVHLAGEHVAVFDAEDLPSGTYFYRLYTPAGVFTREMVVAK